MKVLGTWVVGILFIAGLVVVAKDQSVLDTVFSDSTKMLATAMGGNA